MRKITVTEENFNKVLDKMQKICNKYKMFEFYRVLTEDMKEEKQYRRGSIGFNYTVKTKTDKNGELICERVKKFFSYNNYVRVTKHRFREEFEQGKDTYDAKYCYPKMKSLIRMDLPGCRVLVISEGDKVQFLPFGGFVVWTDNNFTRFESPLIIYKYIFIPDFFKGKIKSLEDENAIRDEEWEEWEECWNKQHGRTSVYLYK